MLTLSPGGNPGPEQTIFVLIEHLYTARASTAGIQWIFSTFGFVHSRKTRFILQT